MLFIRFSLLFSNKPLLVKNTIVLQRHCNVLKKNIFWHIDKKSILLQQSHRCFHRTPQLKLNPLFFRIGSIYVGRKLRLLWKKLPDHEKIEFKTRLKKYNRLIYPVLLLIVVSLVLNYYMHLEEDPITHRRKYITLTNDQFSKIIDTEYKQMLLDVSKDLINASHPIYTRVSNIVTHLIKSNQEITELNSLPWQIFIVQSPQRNVCVLPNGSIFIYTGIFEFAQNDSRFAAILSHEMAHVLCKHALENISQAGLLDYILIFCIGAIWFIIPNDILAFLTQSLQDRLIHFFFHLPYSRKLETEADLVGLELMTKACYDVRECSHLWQAFLEKEDVEGSLPELLSTHPSSETRIQNFNKLIAEAIIKRLECNCYPLGDSREKMKIVK